MSRFRVFTIKKIFANVFKNKEGRQIICVEDKHEQKRILTEIKELLDNLDNQSIRSDITREMQLIVDIKRERFTVYFINKTNFLRAHDYGAEESFIADYQEIVALAKQYIAKIAEQEKREVQNSKNRIKNDKLKELKHKAIIAKIEEIAAEEKFEYMIEPMATKMKISIRLDKNDYMEIDIHYSKFQEMLMQVTNAYHALMKLKENNISVKVKYSTYTCDFDWEQK